MKETSFIDQNKKKWHRYERLSESDNADPNELGDLYMELTNDLAYSQTHYPRRTVRVYLNNLAYSAVLKFNRAKKRKFSFSKLVAQDIPLSLYGSRKSIYLAFAIFVLGFLIGAFSTEQDGNYLVHWTGESYLWMTEDNIAKGDPLGVYGDSAAWPMFSHIVVNNLRVGLITFILGALLGLGSMFYLAYNSLMVGAFQWYFKVKGLLWVSFLGIWIHGAFEITSIILCAAAGMELWRGFFFPGTLSRREGFKRSGRAAVRMFLTVSVFIVLAAIFESWVTRHYQSIPDWGKVAIIFSQFGIMLFYFIIWPRVVAKRTDLKTFKEEKTFHLSMPKIVLRRLRTVPEIFSHSVLLFQHNLPRLAKRYLVVGVLGVTLLLIAYKTWWDHVPSYYQPSFWEGYMAMDHGHLMAEVLGIDGFHPVLLLVNGLLLSALAASAFRICIPDRESEKPSWKKVMTTLMVDTLMVLPFALILMFVSIQMGVLTWLVLPAVLPFVIPCAVSSMEEKNIGKGIAMGMKTGGNSYGKAVGLSYVLGGLTWMAAMLFGVTDWSLLPPPIENQILPLSILGNMVSLVYPTESAMYYVVMDMLVIIFTYLLIFLLLPVWTLCFRLLVLDRKERDDPQETLKKISQLGKRSKVYETSLDYE